MGHHISFSKNTLKLIYGKVEFQKFSGGNTPDPRFRGGKGRGGEKGRLEGMGEWKLGGEILTPQCQIRSAASART